MKNVKLNQWGMVAGLMAVSSTVVAQTSTIYGLIDVGVETIQNVATVQVPTPGAATSSLTRMPTNTNTAPSRFGIRGSEDLGNGLSAVYAVEAGFDPGNGGLNQGGRLFGRQAFVGLKGAAGTLSLGRQYTMIFWSGLDADILGGGIYGTGSLDAYLPNARADNSVVWMGKFSNWSLGANYSLGRDTVTATPTNPAATNCPGESADSSACRQYSLMAKYDTASWGVAMATNSMKGGSAGTFGGLTTSAMTDTRNVLNGWVKFDKIKVGGGIIARKNDGSASLPQGSRSNLLHVGASMPITPQLTLAAQYVDLRYQHDGSYNSRLLALRGTYALSKRVETYLQVASIRNSEKARVSVSGGAPLSSPPSGKSQQAINAGLRMSF